jgi:SAM-dependent methyltransferase
VTGLDLDAASIEQGRQLASELKNIEFRFGSLEVQQFRECIDVAICSEVLEHVEEPRIFMGQIADAMKEGGLLLVTVPNGFGYFEIESFFWRLVSRCPGLVNNFLYRFENWCWKAFGSAEVLRRRREEYRPERLGLTQSTLAPEMGHCRSFTRSKIIRLLKSAGFHILEIQNNTFLAGNLLGLLVRELDAILIWNARVADRLPSFMVSGWMIAARKLRDQAVR